MFLHADSFIAPKKVDFLGVLLAENLDVDSVMESLGIQQIDGPTRA